MDLFDKIDRAMQRDLGQFASFAHGYATFPKLTGELGPNMKFRGNDVLVWSLNNYLGLANHPEVRKADTEATAQYGLAYPMGSRMLTGNTDEHERFEAMAAKFMEKEDAFLLNFGYQGCVSIVEAITSRHDVIVYDQLSHACIIDGMNQSMAKRFVFAHNNMAQLEDRLQKAQAIVDKTRGGILVITEGVFGMKGDMGQLDEIVALKKKYQFRLFIDDAHGFGLMGKTGKGTAEHYGVQKDVDLIFCTFAKSLALVGAFVCGDKKIIHYLRYNMRSQIYAKSLPMPIVLGAIKRLEMLMSKPELREKVHAIAARMQKGLREMGFDLGDTNTPVTPVYMSITPEQIVDVIKDVRENYKLFLSAVTYPVIEKGKLIFRIIPTADHTFEQVDYTLGVFSEIRDKLKSGFYTQKVPVSA